MLEYKAENKYTDTKSDKFHQNLLIAVRDKISDGTNVAKILMDILKIGKEAAYRRLRGEVKFNFEEVALIAERLNLSLDEIVENNILENRLFQMALTDYIHPTESDYLRLESFIDMVRKAGEDPDIEMGYSANMIPMALHNKCDWLTKFYTLKWLYQSSGADMVRSLKDIYKPPRLYEVGDKYVEVCENLAATYYIWDSWVFRYLVNDIKHFSRIHFITPEDVKNLREELLWFLDWMEKVAVRGHFDSGKKIQFYLSNTNFESTYAYMRSQDTGISLIGMFTLNYAISFDYDTYNKLRNWIESLKRLSTLISESGEVQRVRFFKEQRELIKTL